MSGCLVDILPTIVIGKTPSVMLNIDTAVIVINHAPQTMSVKPICPLVLREVCMAEIPCRAHNFRSAVVTGKLGKHSYAI